MVTSTQPFEGKTITASNLALALAVTGARVLLIDADMRRSGVHRRLGIENGAGLSDVLTGRASFDDAVVRLDEQLHAVAVAELGEGTVVVVGQHVRLRAPQVPEEAFGDFLAVHHAARDGRQVTQRIVTPTPPEFAASCSRVLRDDLDTPTIPGRRAT